MKEGIRELSYKGFYFKLNLHLLLVCKLNYLERSFTYGTRCIINVFFYVFSQLYILPLSTLIHNKCCISCVGFLSSFIIFLVQPMP